MRLLPAVLLASLASCSVFGQTYTISTFAGGGLPVNIPGISACLPQINGVAVDPAGNIFMTSGLFHVVLRLDSLTGVLALVAGNGTPGFSGDNGPAAEAQLNFPIGVALDAAGNLYIGDLGNGRVRKVSNGMITTVPSSGVLLPWGIAVDSAGSLYIAEAGFARVRKVSNGVITTVAGTGTQGYSGDNGPGASAQVNQPRNVAVDSSGNVYIADTNNIRKVSNGVITTVAGGGSSLGDNGPATSAQVFPVGVAVDSAGNLYFDDTYRIRRVSNGVITTIAGKAISGFSGDNGLATAAELGATNGVALDSAGSLYVNDYSNLRIRKISSGVITTVAGNGW